MTADDMPIQSLQRSGNSLSGEEAAPRRRHAPALYDPQGGQAVSHVLETPPSGSGTSHQAAGSEEETSDDDEQRLLSSGGRSSDRSRVRLHAADSGTAYELAFDGIEATNGQPNGISGGKSGALRTLAQRHVPGLILFWDGITPELVAVSMVYVVQGLLDMTILAISYFLKDGLHMTPARAGFWLALGKGPWLVKPLWGFLSDAFPIAGYRRRSWLLLVNLIGTLGWVGLGLFAFGPATALLFLLATNLGLAFGDVIVDAIVVGMARDEPSERAGSLQSLCWGSRAVGSIASAWFGGWLVELLGPRPVLLLAAVFPAGVAATAFMITEHRVDGLRKHAHEGVLTAAKALLVSQTTMLWSAIRRRSVWAPMIFTFFWSAAPTAEPAMFFFATNRLGFSPEFLGRVQLFAGVAELIGVWVYNRYLKAVPLRRVLGWTLVAGTASGATQLILVTGANRALGLSDKLFALGDSVIINALYRIALMPVFVLSARICPEGVEATLFATLMSIGNASMVASAGLGSGLTALFGVTATNFTHLPALVLFCALSRLLALPLLMLLPTSLDTEEASQQEEMPLEPKADVSMGPVV